MSRPPTSRRMGRAPRLGSGPGDVLLAIGLEPVETTERAYARSIAATPGGRLRYTVLRLNAREAREITLGSAVARATPRSTIVLAAVGIFTLLVGGGGADAAPGDPSDAAFLLAGRRSSACSRSRSAAGSIVSTGCSTGPTRCRFCAAAALPALHAGLPRAAAELGAQLDRPLDAAAAVCAGCFAGSRAGRRRRAGADEPVVLHELVGAPRPLRACCICRRASRPACWSLVAPFGRVRSVTARRQLRWIVWGTALGAMPFAIGYAVPWAFGFSRRCRWSCRRSRCRPGSARLRVGDRPLSPDGRRDHLQARRRLGDRRRGDRRPLRRAAEGGDGWVFAATATDSAG